MEIKEQYEKFAKKYKLPDYGKLDDEFELLYFTSIIEISHVLRFVRRRINDRLSTFTGVLQGLLQPNPSSPISLEESSFLDENDKKKIVMLIRELMNLERRNSLLDLNFDEEQDVYYIKEAVDKWFELKKDIFVIISKVKKGWETKAKEDYQEPYFG